MPTPSSSPRPAQPRRWQIALGLFGLFLFGVVLGLGVTQARAAYLQRRRPAGPRIGADIPLPAASVLATPSVDPAPSPTPSAAPAQTPAASLATPVASPLGAHGRILMYHYVRVVDPKKDPLGYRLSVTPDELDAQLTALSQAGYRPANMDDVVSGRTDAHSAVLTFDDGYEDFYAAAWPILKKHGWTATVYVISGKIGGPYMTWDQIRELHAAGIEIGAHTVDHVDLGKATEASQRHQIFDSKATIEQEIGAPVTAFCYPSGKSTPATEQLVRQAGFTSATTTAEGPLTDAALRDPYAIPRLRVEPGVSLDRLLK